MSDRRGRLDQIEVELQRAEEGGGRESRMDCGANVVTKSGKRQLRRACPAPDGLAGLDDANRSPGLSERDRSSKAVRPCPDDDGV
jgi:hypothetical protein